MLLELVFRFDSGIVRPIPKATAIILPCEFASEGGHESERRAVILQFSARCSSLSLSKIVAGARFLRMHPGDIVAS